MKDFYKKANFYFIALPVLAAVWVVLTSTVFLNSANDEWKGLESEKTKSEKIAAQILALDQDRMKLHKEREKYKKFDFTTVVTKFIIRHKIPESEYGLRDFGGKVKKGVQIQTARLSINNIDIETLTRFMTEILRVWPNLQCEDMTIKKANKGPDSWNATIDLKYTFKSS